MQSRSISFLSRFIMQPDCINDLRMKEATAKSAMNSEYFRTAWMTYNCCYYYSYELETAIPLRATPFLGWLPYLFFQESQGYVYRRNQHHGCLFRFNQYLFLLGDLLLLSYEIQLLYRLFSKDNLL